MLPGECASANSNHFPDGTEISEMELTAEELNDVSGGLKNNQTAGYRAFMSGVIDGYTRGGGTVSVMFQ